MESETLESILQEQGVTSDESSSGDRFIQPCASRDNQFTKTDKRPGKPQVGSICHLCSQTFKDRLALARHQVESHTMDRTFPCTHCDKTFKEVRTLRLHLKIHNSEYPEQCGVCSKVFRTKWQLKQHLMDHGGERPYPCPECTFTCKTKQQLNEHRRKHSGEKAYSCPQCGTRFTYRNGLIKHTKLNRCPKKIVTAEGETIIKKRSRILTKFPSQEENSDVTISSLQPSETSGVDLKKLDPLQLQRRPAAGQPRKIGGEVFEYGNVPDKQFSIELVKKKHEVNQLGDSTLGPSLAGAPTILTTSSDISSWAATLPAGTKVTVTHYDASKKHQGELVATPTHTETIIVTDNVENQTLQQRRMIISKGSISSTLPPISMPLSTNSQIQQPQQLSTQQLSSQLPSLTHYHSQEALNLFSSIGFPNYVESFAVDPNEILRKEKFVKSEPATPIHCQDFKPDFKHTVPAPAFTAQVKSEDLEYCPVNEIKKEVLSELFDCEPDLMLTSQSLSNPLVPAAAAAAAAPASPVDNLVLQPSPQHDLLQVKSEVPLQPKLEPFSPLASPDSGFGDCSNQLPLTTADGPFGLSQQQQQQLGLLEQQIQLKQEQLLDHQIAQEQDEGLTEMSDSTMDVSLKPEIRPRTILPDFDVDFNSLLEEIHGTPTDLDFSLRSTGESAFKENHLMDIVSSV